jgi:hypothetical protein
MPDPGHSSNSSCDSEFLSPPPIFASISSFSVLFDGADPNISSHTMCAPDGSLILRYCSPVRWNGWFFVTSTTAPPEHDPVRFVLHARSGAPGAPWSPAGSSSFARIHVSTALFHGAFPTPTARGARSDLDLERHRVGSLWLSIAAAFALAAAGALRREELGEPLLAAFYAAWVLANLARAAAYLRAGQRDGAAVHGLLAATHAGNLLLMIRGHWTLQCLWHGGMQLAAAAVLCPFEFRGAAHPAAFFLPSGPVYVAIGAALALHRPRTARRAVALVAADRRAYDAAWREAAAERAGGLRSLERTVARLLARSEAVAAGCCKQPRQPPGGEKAWREALRQQRAKGAGGAEEEAMASREWKGEAARARM